jgi:hypothetical protein
MRKRKESVEKQTLESSVISVLPWVGFFFSFSPDDFLTVLFPFPL